MRKSATLAFALAALALSNPPARAEGPCHDKREAKHAARKALHSCIETWGRAEKPGEPDPSEDCGSKMSAFVQAAKDLKACRTTAEEERKKKQEEHKNKK